MRPCTSVDGGGAARKTSHAGQDRPEATCTLSTVAASLQTCCLLPCGPPNRQTRALHPRMTRWTDLQHGERDVIGPTIMRDAVKEILLHDITHDGWAYNTFLCRYLIHRKESRLAGFHGESTPLASAQVVCSSCLPASRGGGGGTSDEGRARLALVLAVSVDHHQSHSSSVCGTLSVWLVILRPSRTANADCSGSTGPTGPHRALLC